MVRAISSALLLLPWLTPLAHRWWKAFDELEASWGDAPHWNVIAATVNRELRRDDLN